MFFFFLMEQLGLPFEHLIAELVFSAEELVFGEGGSTKDLRSRLLKVCGTKNLISTWASELIGSELAVQAKKVSSSSDHTLS